MRFSIKGKVYDAATLDDVTLRDTLVFESQMAELGRPMSWGDLLDLVAHLATIDDPTKRGKHPDATWSLAVTVWASRRMAGENVTISEAADFRLTDLEWVTEPDPSADRTGAASDPLDGQPAEGLAGSE